YEPGCQGRRDRNLLTADGLLERASSLRNRTDRPAWAARGRRLAFGMTQRRAVPALVLLVCAIGLLLIAPAALAAATALPQVYAFPTPGSHVASPKSQIVFRGVPITSIGTVTVAGSKSGVHAGTLRGDSDGRGASFLPTTAFSPGETVTVTTSLNIRGAFRADIHLTVGYPAAGCVTRNSPCPAPRPHLSDAVLRTGVGRSDDRGRQRWPRLVRPRARRS